MATDPLDPTGALAELSQLLRSERELTEILNDVVQLARRHIAGSDDASITLIRRATAGTVATTGELAEVLDELQYEKGYGPCLDAGRADEIVHIQDAATETRWPRYIPPARDNGLGSSLSIPLPVENYLIGALNLYSMRPHAFPEEVVALSESLSAHITAALSSVEARESHRTRALNLERAMEARSVIEQAKGMIMVQQKCTATAAFDLLRQLSMEQNVKLRDLAASLVSSASGHPVRFDQPAV